MSGSIDYSVLFAPAATDSTSLLSILAGGGAPGGGGANALTALSQAERNETKDVGIVARQPQVARLLATFTAAVNAAKTPADLLKNPQVLDVLLTANGLGDQTAYTALARKALLSDIKVASSVANQLSDTRWKTLAKAYDFANKGLSLIQNPTALATIANQYAEVTWRKSLDAATPGLSKALDFRARAGAIKSVDQVLGDANFRAVVLSAFNIPLQIAYQGLPAQEQAVSQRLDLAKLKDPHYIDSITQRYLQSQKAAPASGAISLETLAVQAQGLIA